MKRVIFTIFISLVLFSCSNFKTKEHKYISFVFDNSKDTIQIEDVTEHKEYYLLKDKSKINKSKVIWSRIDEKKLKSWKEIQKEKKRKRSEKAMEFLLKMAY